MELATAYANHGITTLDFWQCKESKRLIAFHKSFSGMVKFITKEEFDSTKPIYAYAIDDCDDFADEDGNFIPCVGYWLSNTKGKTPALTLTL